MTISEQQLRVTPPSSTRLVVGLVVAVVLAALGASQLTYAKKDYVDGLVQTEGGDLRVIAPSNGVVRYNVAVGDTVAAGRVLAVLETRDVLPGGGSVRESQQQALAAKGESFRAEQAGALTALAARAQALAAQHAMASAAVAQATAEVASRRQYLELEEHKLARQKSLRDQGFISAVAVEDAEASLLDRRVQVQAAERAVTDAKASLASVDAEQAAHAAASASQRQQLERELLGLRLDGAQAQRDAGVGVIAPRAATVVARATAAGDAAQAGQLLLQLSPTGVPLEAVLLLPATAAGRVQPGQPVTLQMAAYPYQTYGLVHAQVTHVDKSPLVADEARVLHGSGLAAGSVVVAATARITQIPRGIASLKSGMQFRAAVEIERKSFLAWLVAPLMKNFQ